MNNLRKVNDDILKDWLLFREDEISSLSCDKDRNHWVYFDEISERILKNVRILWIIFAIGMRSIIGMDLLMEFS